MKKFIGFITILFLFSSCKNLVFYTDSMQKKYSWNEDQIKRIQFFVSHDIVLRQEAAHGSTEIVKGTIKNVKGRKLNEIIIPSGTKGIVTDIPREGKFLVSFEMGDDKSLSFGVNPTTGKYVLLASDWKNEMGKVHYAETEYYTDPDSKYAALMVDLRKIEKLQMKQRVAKGRKVQ